MRIQVYTLNAFAKTENGGNPAGVVLEAEGLTALEMQMIASKVGFSETAFVTKADSADFKVRFFTPSAEVDLCGHATIATFYLLASKGIVETGEYTQETKAGILKVECCRNRVVFMSQNKPVFCQEINKAEIADSLNINESILLADSPAQIVSTGIRDIIIPVCSLEELQRIKPDFKKVEAVSKKYDVVGYHLFTRETMYSSTAHCRNFAPLYDIPEEAATGTSNGALGCYLLKYGIVNKDSVKHMVFEQGYSMQRPSEIMTSLTVQNEEITAVKVGGTAMDTNEIVIEI